MAIVSKDEVFVLTLSRLEASVLLGAFDCISGDVNKAGRRETEAISNALEEAGVSPMECFVGEITNS